MSQVDRAGCDRAAGSRRLLRLPHDPDFPITWRLRTTAAPTNEKRGCGHASRQLCQCCPTLSSSCSTGCRASSASIVYFGELFIGHDARMNRGLEGLGKSSFTVSAH